jgi:glycosyltransferase involved in cell wall biosynthesis
MTAMRIAIVADVFPPLRSSGAVQLRDLVLELFKQGHQPTVMIPSSDIDPSWLLESFNGVQVLRLKAPRTKDIGYIRRTLNEFLMPLAMLRHLKKSPLADTKWDGVVWYSPTIFLGPVAKALKEKSACRSYLIIRDIFPEWAVDMGLLGRGLPYRFFKMVERYQYSVANVIGVQTPSNLDYFKKWAARPNQRVEVLQNWLANAPDIGCSISIDNSALAGRSIFVYAGNMGLAQGVGIFLKLAELLIERKDIGFVFVGRGTETLRLGKDAASRGLDNVLFYDEIDPSEIPGLYAQCHAGLVALDPRHKTHNIPGKFLSYMQSGLPVLASINRGNDLAQIIERESVGRVCTDHSMETLLHLVDCLVHDIANDADISGRCIDLSEKLFSPMAAVKQLTGALLHDEVSNVSQSKALVANV